MLFQNGILFAFFIEQKSCYWINAYFIKELLGTNSVSNPYIVVIQFINTIESTFIILNTKFHIRISADIFSKTN